MTEKERFVLDHYEITKDGRVLSKWHPKFHGEYHELKYRTDKDGYKDVALVYDNSGNRRPFRVHILVALKYIPNPNNYPVINHKDSDKQNNCVENLEWCSVAYNTQHGYDNCVYSNIRKVKVTEINNVVNVFPSVSEASRYYRYSNPTTIQRFLTQHTTPTRGRLAGAKIEYTEEGVTTIERNTVTVGGV